MLTPSSNPPPSNLPPTNHPSTSLDTSLSCLPTLFPLAIMASQLVTHDRNLVFAPLDAADLQSQGLLSFNPVPESFAAISAA